MEVSEACFKAERARQKIRSARVMGHGNTLKGALRSYVRNIAVKYEAAYRAIGKDADAAVIERAVARLNMFAADDSRIFYWRVPKRIEGFRVVYRLTLNGRMRQVILKDAIECSFQPGAHLFLIKTRGRDREARLIQDALLLGYRFGVRADICDAFPSANVLQALDKTPLPRSVIRNNLVYGNRQFIHDWRKEAAGYIYPHFHHEPLAEGLIQGAASSSVIFAVLLNDLPEAFHLDVRVFVYGDDILVLARSEEERAAARAILERYTLTHPAGPFRIEASDVDAHTGFDRVGYGYRRSIVTERIEIVPDTRRMRVLENRLQRLAELNVRHSWPPIRGGAVALRNLERGFPAISDPADLKDELLLWMDVAGDSFKEELLAGLRVARARW